MLAHAHSLAGIRHAVAAGVDGIEHFTGLTEEGLSMPDDVLELVAAAGVQVCPTAGADPARVPPPELMPLACGRPSNGSASTSPRSAGPGSATSRAPASTASGW